MQDTGYKIQDTRYRIPDTGCRIQDTRYQIPDTRYRILTLQEYTSFKLNGLIRYQVSGILHPHFLSLRPL